MSVRRGVLAVVVATGALAPAPAPAAVAAAAPAADLPRCPGDRAARCGRIRVPLHRTDPGGAQLTVRFRVYLRRDRSRPAGVPIVAAEGGPGYGSIDSGASYRFLLGPLGRDHDLILVDNRGTGRSGAIDCKRLQAGRGDYTRNVGRCARQLGAAADAYGTGAAADDLAAVLDRLAIPVVSIYGDSYGTYFAQAFAVRHPDRVRAVVLDAAYGVDGFDPWGRTTTEAIREAWTLLCRRSSCPGADPLAQLGDLAVRLERTPLTGRARDADGTLQDVRLDGGAFAQLVNDAGYYYALYRDLLAAGAAYDRGDPTPLLRLAAEDLTAVEAGEPETYSEGAFAAVACHDYPTIWNPAASVAARRGELAAARSALVPDAFAPFPTDLWLASLYAHQQVFGCLEWPAPAVPDPPAPPGTPYPAVPVLVLDGDLDVITPLSDSRRAAALYPNATLVTVANEVHVTALANFDRCASGIVRRFLRTLSPGGTGCAAARAELHVVRRFPRHAAAAPRTALPRAGDASRPLDRRAAWTAAQAVADALSRWWLISGSRGHGLRGGRFTATGAYYSYGPVRFRLRRLRFTEDVAVSGRATWERRAQRVRARVRIAGVRRGTLRIGWKADRPAARATISGRLGGRTIRLRMPAP